ncbi:MAG: hypothetical protein ACYC2K_14865 [Gemmatimonadales bacterium]
MLKHRLMFLALTAAAVSLASPLGAQTRSAIRPVDLEASVVAVHATAGDSVRAILASDEAATLAGRMGVSSAELAARVATLDDATLVRFAESAEADRRVLAGGADRIVISTTAIIIALLLLILLTD